MPMVRKLVALTDTLCMKAGESLFTKLGAGHNLSGYVFNLGPEDEMEDSSSTVV